MTEKILFFSEDIAEIKSAVWHAYYLDELKDMTGRGKELYEKLEKIYNELYCSGGGKQVILEDMDRRSYGDTNN